MVRRGPPKAWKKKPTGARRRPAMRRKRAPMTIVNRALHPIPSRFITKMKYSDTVAVTTLQNTFAFNLNSVFDPNRTGVGHQPYGHDTLASLYNRYRVISCGWRINVALGTSGSPIQVGCMPANEVLTITSINELRENPRAKYILQNPGSGSVYLSGKSYIPSLVGRTKNQYMADDRYQAQVGASPSELAILNLIATDAFDAPIALTLQVLLEYTVEWFDVKHLAQS